MIHDEKRMRLSGETVGISIFNGNDCLVIGLISETLVIDIQALSLFVSEASASVFSSEVVIKYLAGEYFQCSRPTYLKV